MLLSLGLMAAAVILSGELRAEIYAATAGASSGGLRRWSARRLADEGPKGWPATTQLLDRDRRPDELEAWLTESWEERGHGATPALIEAVALGRGRGREAFLRQLERLWLDPQPDLHEGARTSTRYVFRPEEQELRLTEAALPGWMTRLRELEAGAPKLAPRIARVRWAMDFTRSPMSIPEALIEDAQRAPAVVRTAARELILRVVGNLTWGYSHEGGAFTERRERWKVGPHAVLGSYGRHEEILEVARRALCDEPTLTRDASWLLIHLGCEGMAILNDELERGAVPAPWVPETCGAFSSIVTREDLPAVERETQRLAARLRAAVLDLDAEPADRSNARELLACRGELLIPLLPHITPMLRGESPSDAVLATVPQLAFDQTSRWSPRYEGWDALVAAQLACDLLRTGEDANLEASLTLFSSLPPTFYPPPLPPGSRPIGVRDQRGLVRVTSRAWSPEADPESLAELFAWNQNFHHRILDALYWLHPLRRERLVALVVAAGEADEARALPSVELLKRLLERLPKTEAAQAERERVMSALLSFPRVLGRMLLALPNQDSESPAMFARVRRDRLRMICTPREFEQLEALISRLRSEEEP